MSLKAGALPDWAPYGAAGASAALAALLLFAAGSFSVALLLVLRLRAIACVVIYAWSRAVEGPRRAKDRLVTLLDRLRLRPRADPAALAGLRGGRSAASPASASNSSPATRAARSAAAAPPTRSSARW